jgi:hypothetical protein
MRRLIRRRRRGTARGRPGFERALFSFMGPPQIGEDRAPEGYVQDEAANRCPKCHQPWDEHESVHTGSMTYVRCPAATP